MSTENQKLQLLQAVRETLGALADVTDRARAVSTAYVERAYDSGASDPVTQEQLDAFGVIPYDLGAAHGLCVALVALLDQPVNRATVSKWRQV